MNSQVEKKSEKVKEKGKIKDKNRRMKESRVREK